MLLEQLRSQALYLFLDQGLILDLLVQCDTSVVGQDVLVTRLGGHHKFVKQYF